jgi:hypothetical protein
MCVLGQDYLAKLCKELSEQPMSSGQRHSLEQVQGIVQRCHAWLMWRGHYSILAMHIAIAMSCMFDAGLGMTCLR